MDHERTNQRSNREFSGPLFMKVCLSLVLCLISGCLTSPAASDLPLPANADPLRSAHRDVTQAMLGVSDAKLKVARYREARLEALYSQHAAAWLELAAAESATTAAEADYSAKERLLKRVRATTSGSGPVPNPADSRPMIDLTLPESSVTIGWFHIASLPEPQRMEVLNLLEDNSQIPAVTPSVRNVAEFQLETARQVLEILRKTSADSEEIAIRDLDVQWLEAELALRQAERRRDDAEQAIRRTQIQRCREQSSGASMTIVDSDSDRKRRSSLNRQVLAALKQETESAGSTELTHSITELLSESQQATQTLRQTGLTSRLETEMSRQRLMAHKDYVSAVRELQDWKRNWVTRKSQLMTPDETGRTGLSDHQLEECDPGDVPGLVDIWFDQARLESELQELLGQRRMHDRLQSKLQELADGNPREEAISRRVVELLNQRIELTQSQLVGLSERKRLCVEISRWKQTGVSNPDLLDTETLQLIVRAAQLRVDQDSVASPVSLSPLRNRLDQLRSLHQQGYASVAEVRHAELQILNAQAQSEQQSTQARRNRVTLRILELILASGLADCTHHESNESALPEQIPGTGCRLRLPG